ncbi:MAG: hypothetical protein Q9176_005681 [Flavoplaca citrina]
MSSKPAEVPRYEKRELEVEETPGLTALPTPKRQKLKHQQQNFPPSFWDNLSQLWLTTRSLREFDRRTVWPSTPKQPHLTGAAQIDSNQLVQFAQEGGPDLRDLRAYPRAEEASSDPAGISTDMMASNTSAYSKAFEQHMIDHGCFPPEYPLYGAVKPQNFDEIVARLERPIPSSPAFTAQEFTDYLVVNKSCINEAEVMNNVISGIFAVRKPLPHGLTSQFNNLESLTGCELVEPMPDWHDGISPSSLAVTVRNRLENFIVPSTNPSRLCVPNFLFEVKGPDGSITILLRQAMFAGVLGARGVHELRHWLDPHTLDDNKAYTIAATYEPVQRNLIFYAIHPTRSNNTAHQALSSTPARYYTYRMTKLKAWMLDSDVDTFNKGMWAFQNARQWAKEQRDLLCAAANLKAESKEPAFMASGSQGSSDELGMDGACG